MPAAYKIGEEILVKPVREQDLSIRESTLTPYTGQTGKILNYHWIIPPTGEVFYLYTVLVDNGNKEIVLYEDEIQHMYDRRPQSSEVEDK